MQTSKEQFILEASKKIEMNKSFKDAMMTIKNIVLAHNGKKVTKRFIDAINKELELNNIKVVFSFDKNYRGVRTQRLIMTYTNRYFGENDRFCLDYSSTMNTLYPGTCPEYLNDDFVLNSENLIKVLDWENNRLSEINEDYTRGINEVDNVINIYKELNEYAKSKMNSLPKCLQDHRGCSHFYCPIY